eukprot:99884-Pyramimonas_sp.AAC.1
MEDVEISTPRQEGGGSSSSQQAQPAASATTPRPRKRSASEAETPEVEMGTVGGVEGFVMDEADTAPAMDPEMDIDWHEG